MRSIGKEWVFRKTWVSGVSIRIFYSFCLVLAVWICASSNAWALTANPTTVIFQAVQGAANPPSQTVTLSKSSKRSSAWLATDNAAWLTVSAGSGIIRQTAKIALAVNTAGLAAGIYTAVVTINADRGGGIASVPVTLTVTPSTMTSSASPTPVASTSTTAMLTWSPVTSTNLAGYKVYMGTASGRYGTPLIVGNVSSYVLSNLTAGTTYYFVVTSYNSSGGESAPSNEVSKSIY